LELLLDVRKKKKRGKFQLLTGERKKGKKGEEEGTVRLQHLSPLKGGKGGKPALQLFLLRKEGKESG